MNDTSKGFRIFLGVFCAVIAFILLTCLFQLKLIIENGLDGFFQAIPFLIWVKLFISVMVGLLGYLLPQNGLNQMKSRRVGDNQHGSADWLSEKEKRKVTNYVKDGQEETPGIVIGRFKKKWIIDTSEQTLCLLAPPGGGKTKSVFVPTFRYNAKVNQNTNGKGASILSVDVKRENFARNAKALEDSGYINLYLDFRNPLYSYRFNLLHVINVYMDKHKKAISQRDKALYYAKAEKYAKQVSNSIVKNTMGEAKDDSEQFFNNTASGLITGLILLVSLYGGEGERHIISVFKLVIELNGLADSNNMESGQQRSKLAELLESVDDDRIINYVGASMNADVRTSMNIFSSALSKLVDFIDAELEQMVCEHSPEIDPVKFIEKPTAIFLICPDEDSSRHFFASLFIRYFTTQLIELAESEYNGELPRKVLCLWDEFGNMPAVKDADSLFTAARSRGIRIMYSVQSLFQLEKSYNRTLANIIKESSQMLMFTFVSALSYDTAKQLSEMLGSKTILSGTVSRGTSNGQENGSTSYQMISRQLKTPDEIMKIPIGHYVVKKSGVGNMETVLPLYTDYLEKEKSYNTTVMYDYTTIRYLTSEKIRNRANRDKNHLYSGMFD